MELEDRARLAIQVYNKVCNQVDSLLEADGMGGNLAYLLGAILKGTYTELDADGFDLGFFKLLRDCFDPVHAVWTFVKLAEESTRCARCGSNTTPLHTSGICGNCATVSERNA